MQGRFEKLIFTVMVLAVVSSSGAVRGELVAYWDLDDRDGPVAADMYGINQGILKSSPQWVDGRFKGALKFDGIDDYVDCGNNEAMAITDRITLAMWIKADPKQRFQATMLSKGDKSWRIALFRAEDAVEMGCSGTSGEWQSGTTKVKDSAWHHIAGVYDGANLYVYVDGKLDPSKPSTGKISKTSDPVWIGGNNAYNIDRSFKGLIDEVAVFDHALTGEEVAQLHKDGVKSFMQPSLSRLIDDVREVKSATYAQKPEEAVGSIEKTVMKWERWKQENPSDFGPHHRPLLSELYFMLAKSRQAARGPAGDIAEAYKRSASATLKSPNYAPALLWLFRNAPRELYAEAVKESMRGTVNGFDYIHRTARYFEANGDWSAFECLLDNVLPDVNNAAVYATAIAQGLTQNGIWANNFQKYCRDKPRLTQYLIGLRESAAREYIRQNDYEKAVQTYQEIATLCGSDPNRVAYEFKACECLFQSGLSGKVISDLNGFIEKYRATERATIIQALVLKGRAYLQMGETDSASDVFLELMIDYPETKKAPEANFFVGYCNMLQGNLNEAKEAFELVIKDYPQSPEASKSRLCLRRIEKMAN